MKKGIRFEAIGGQGAHSAGKILAEAAVLGMGFEGNHFSSFGSEKRGSPVRSSVRYRDDGHAVRSASPIFQPDCLVIFHPNLIQNYPPVCEGYHNDLFVIINSPLPPQQIEFPEGFKARSIASIDALKIANQLKVGINAVLLGATLKFCPEIQLMVLKETFRKFFSHLSFEMIRNNLIAIENGFELVKSFPYSASQSSIPSVGISLPKLGYENAPLGGLIANPGNTILKDMSHSRKGSIPKLNFEKCIQCGFCDMVCPDYCFVWQRSVIEETLGTLPGGKYAISNRELSVPILQGIDYRYCKACSKCVEACPVGALKTAPDTKENRAYSQAQRFRAIEMHESFPVFQEVEYIPEE